MAIIGNLLDNAITAVENCKDNKFIKVTAKKNNGEILFDTKGDVFIVKVILFENKD